MRSKFNEQLAVTAILLSTTLPQAYCKDAAAGDATTKTPPDMTKSSTESSTTSTTSTKSTGPTSSEPVSTKSSDGTATSTDPATTKPTDGTSPTEPPKPKYDFPTLSAPAASVPAKVIPEKPKEKPAPAGQAEAVKLYSTRKFAPAAAMFEKFIKDGTANSETHAYLAYCEYSQRHYSKALRQFDWVAKNTPDNYKLRTSAESSGAILRGQMAGVCPQPCLKTNDPRWIRVGDHREIHWTNSGGGWDGITDHHMGQIITFKNDRLINGGVCPTCGGTGRVTPLKDGDPIPR